MEIRRRDWPVECLRWRTLYICSSSQHATRLLLSSCLHPVSLWLSNDFIAVTSLSTKSPSHSMFTQTNFLCLNTPFNVQSLVSLGPNGTSNCSFFLTHKKIVFFPREDLSSCCNILTKEQRSFGSQINSLLFSATYVFICFYMSFYNEILDLHQNFWCWANRYRLSRKNMQRAAKDACLPYARFSWTACRTEISFWISSSIKKRFIDNSLL